MKTLVMLLAILLTTSAFASHPELEEDKVYRLPAQYMCDSADLTSNVMDLSINKGATAAREYVRVMIGMGRCALFRGGGAKYGGTLKEWTKDDKDFWLILWLDATGREMYGLMGFKAHGAGI